MAKASERQPQPRWHICDEFLQPIYEELARIAATEFKDAHLVADAQKLKWFYCNGAKEQCWLEQYAGPKMSDRLFGRLDRLLCDLREWQGEYREYLDLKEAYRRAPYTEAEQPTAIDGWQIVAHGVSPDYVRSAELQAESHWREVRYTAQEHMQWVIQFAANIRNQIHFEAQDFKPDFVPSELQRLILQTLMGRAFTVEKLMAELDVKSKETIYGKGRRGGLNELADLKLIARDRRVGGWYRPDAPPDGKRTKGVRSS